MGHGVQLAALRQWYCGSAPGFGRTTIRVSVLSLVDAAVTSRAGRLLGDDEKVLYIDFIRKATPGKLSGEVSIDECGHP